MEHLILVLVGGPTVMAGGALAARWLVYRQTDPDAGKAYLAWFRAEKARERAAMVRAELDRLPRQTRPRPKELTRR